MTHPAEGLTVVGAGFGRTGTLSLKRALEQLGWDPCCHMLEVTARADRAEQWLRAAQGEVVDWKAVLRGYKATVDWPGCAFYGELMDAFPDAKVILTTRDPETWYESVADTIFRRPSAGPPESHDAVNIRMVRSIVWQRTMKGAFSDKRRAIEIFEEHIAQVKRRVPYDRLLVFDVGQGWKPLCEFLEKPVPRDDFPRVNDRSTFNDPTAFRKLVDRSLSGKAL